MLEHHPQPCRWCRTRRPATRPGCSVPGSDRSLSPTPIHAGDHVLAVRLDRKGTGFGDSGPEACERDSVHAERRVEHAGSRCLGYAGGEPQENKGYDERGDASRAPNNAMCPHDCPPGDRVDRTRSHRPRLHAAYQAGQESPRVNARSIRWPTLSGRRDGGDASDRPTTRGRSSPSRHVGRHQNSERLPGPHGHCCGGRRPNPDCEKRKVYLPGSRARVKKPRTSEATVAAGLPVVNGYPPR